VAVRPALTSTDSISEIEETLTKRMPLYKNVMDFLVDTDHREIDEICDVILEKLKMVD
jgi:shikimate kinase